MVRLHEGSLLALQECYYMYSEKGVTFALASSTSYPSYAEECLMSLEIVPGVKMGSLFDPRLRQSEQVTPESYQNLQTKPLHRLTKDCIISLSVLAKTTVIILVVLLSTIQLETHTHYRMTSALTSH